MAMSEQAQQRISAMVRYAADVQASWNGFGLQREMDEMKSSLLHVVSFAMQAAQVQPEGELGMQGWLGDTGHEMVFGIVASDILLHPRLVEMNPDGLPPVRWSIHS